MKRILSLLIVCAVSMLWSPFCISQQGASLTTSADTVSTQHFRITYEPGIATENLRGITDEIEIVYKEINGKTMFQLPKQIPTVINTSFMNLMRRLTEKIQSPVVYRRDTLFLVSWYDAAIPPERIQPLLRYAIAFAVLDRGAAHGTPLWLKNGYALRYANFEMPPTQPLVAYMRSFEDFSEEEQLASTPGVSNDYQYLLLKTIDFLITRYSEEKFVTLFTLLQIDKSLAEGFEKAFGEKYTVIEKEWRAYIDTQVGKPGKQKGKEQK